MQIQYLELPFAESIEQSKPQKNVGSFPTLNDGGKFRRWCLGGLEARGNTNVLFEFIQNRSHDKMQTNQID